MITFSRALVFIVLLAACQHVSGQKKNTLTVLTYNIHHANPPSKPGVIDVKAIGAVVRREAPDFVALQEVDVHTGRSGKTVDEAKDIAVDAGMNSCFAKAIDYDGGAYGIAILSKYKIDSTHIIHLPSAINGSENRVLLLAFINMGAKGHLIFACTHMDASPSAASRDLQIEEIIKSLQPWKYPVIIAGDFNAGPDSKVVEKLDAGFIRSCKNGCANTIPSDAPAETIDYIAVRKGDPVSILNHRVLPDAYPSDHLPVAADVQLGK